MERKKPEHKEEVAREALKGSIADFCNLCMEIRVLADNCSHISSISKDTGQGLQRQ